MVSDEASTAAGVDLVSIVTPMYNAQRYILAAINSVLAQTYRNWELLVVDDGSTDRSSSIVEKVARKDARIKLIKQARNAGVALARNAAIRLARGRYIAFLDSDDIWHRQKLEKHIAFMKARKAKLSYTAYSKIDADHAGEVGSQRTLSVPARVAYDELLMSNVIGCSTAIYDAQRIAKQYMLAVGHEDYILWLSILKKHGVAYGLNEPLTAYRVRRDSVSGQKLKAARYQWHIYKDIEKLPLWKSVRYFLSYAYHGYRKFAV